MMRISRIIGRHKDMLSVAIIIATVAFALMAPSLTNASKADVTVKSGSLNSSEEPRAITPNPNRHVCFIVIDGLREADLTDPLYAPLIPNILSLANQGVTYTNGFTTTPADSVPGLLGMFTGASPRTTGYYYDDSYSRILYPAGTTVTGGVPSNPPGAEVTNFEVLDYDFTKLGGGLPNGAAGTGNFDATSINPANCQVSITNGVPSPVFPHNYLKVNTIFEVAQAAGMRTMWADKHPAYEMVNGPSGTGLSDFYSPEIESFLSLNNGVLADVPEVDDPVTGIATNSPKQAIALGVAYDNLVLKACLNQIQGKTSKGAAVPNNVVPAIFGVHYIGVSSFEKTKTGGIDIVNGVTTISADLQTIVKNADNGVGQIVAALKAANLYESTMIVLSAKHGQDPRIGSAIAAPGYSAPLTTAGIVVAQETADNASLLWLADQSKTDAAVLVIKGLKGDPTKAVGTIYSNTASADATLSSIGFGDPMTEDRSPDIVVKLTPGYLIGSTKKKRTEHGGFSDNDTHVALIVSGGIPTNVRGSTQTAVVSNRQAAPLALQYLGLDFTKLQGAQAEGTTALPGILDGPPYFSTQAAANPAYQVLAATPVATNFTAQAVSPNANALTYTWNFGDPTSATNTFSGPGVLPNPNPNNILIGTNVKHTYAAVGNYTATVTVSDGINPPLVSTVKVTVVGAPNPGSLSSIKNVIVIYQENWSFDGLYSKFPGASGLADAQAKLTANPQIDVFNANAALTTLPPPLNGTIDPNFPNFTQAPTLFDISKFIPATTLTGDLIHRFYTEQSQIDGGRMDKFVTLSDNPGLVLSTFDATPMPEGLLAQQYVMCDNFFHGAFGGSFLNHQWLISAQSPTFPLAPSTVGGFVQPFTPNVLNGNFGFDANGNPTPTKVIVNAVPPLVGTGYKSSNVDSTVTNDGFVVNTSFTVNTPHPATQNPLTLIPNQTNATIGDRLNDAGLSWKWYSGGWDNALAGNPDPLFQFHHQPFAYYANYADGTQAKKDHLQDETKFFTDLTNGTLPNVVFIKPLGPDNEHPGYAALAQGQAHVAKIVAAVQASPYWQNCAIIITYDEHGGRYDHVAPPSAATNAPAGTYDRFGPGIRVPGIIISPYAKKGFVDHTIYDTTSILRFIEKRWNLPALGTRDAAVNSLDNAFDFMQPPVVSAPTATPNPVGVGLTTTFSATATSPTSSPLTVAWNFGDPTSATNTASTLMASHVYAAIGTYTATLTVSDGTNPPVVQTVSVKVVTTIVPGTLTLAHASVKLDFKSTGKDSIMFTGSVPLTALPSGAVVVNFGGVSIPLTVTNGVAKGIDSITFKKPRNGVSAVSVKLSKGTFATMLAPLFPNATQKSTSVKVPVSILLANTSYSATATTSYTATQGKSGSAR